MSVQSDAAKAHIEKLLLATYGEVQTHVPTRQKDLYGQLPQQGIRAFREYRFFEARRWRLDFAVPGEFVAIEIQGGNFVHGAHSNPQALRSGYEKLNAAASAGWRVWQLMPEMIIKAGRKVEKVFCSYSSFSFFDAKLCLMNRS